MLQSVSVRDFMATDITTFTPDMDVFHATQMLVHKKYSGACVVDEQDKLVGT